MFSRYINLKGVAVSAIVVFDKIVSWIPFNGFLRPLAMTYSTFFVSAFLKRVYICVIWKEIYTKIRVFAIIINGFQLLAIFGKCTILDIWLCFE